MLLESIRWFVKLIRAVMPVGAGAASAEWIAFGSGLGGGTGPVPAAATAIAAPAAIADAKPATSASRRRVEMVRRNFMWRSCLSDARTVSPR